MEKERKLWQTVALALGALFLIPILLVILPFAFLYSLIFE